MNPFEREFRKREALLRQHGVGLSVDVYTPDVGELQHALEEDGLRPDYVEVFKAPGVELAKLRDRFIETPLAYHAEGLWFIDPEMQRCSSWTRELDLVARHAEILGASWINHECASKRFGGYPFGTYLPPLFTRAAAEIAASHIILCQEHLDRWFLRRHVPAPLLLLELPPVTYFAFGDLRPAEFFAWLADRTPCGFVLDIGHMWTIWRYDTRGQQVSLENFVDEFLHVFPLPRVVQIHLAGLAPANAFAGSTDRWIDAHAARVPDILWDLLQRILADRRLISLKGVALEVDTKEIPLIVHEFGRLRDTAAVTHWGNRGTVPCSSNQIPQLASGMVVPDHTVEYLYRAYARVISGQESLEGSILVPLTNSVDLDGLYRYITEYLPHELLVWGGDLAALFPKVWQELAARDIHGADFVRYWFEHPHVTEQGYDFFSIKLDRWVSFVQRVAPDLAADTEREACVLRTLHAEFNDEPKQPADNVSA